MSACRFERRVVSGVPSRKGPPVPTGACPPPHAFPRPTGYSAGISRVTVVGVENNAIINNKTRMNKLSEPPLAPPCACGRGLELREPAQLFHGRLIP